MNFSFKIIATAFAVCAVLPALQSANLPELYFNPPPREIRIGKEMTDVVKNGKSELEIVAPKSAGGVVKYSAEELQKFLQQSTGAKIPVVEQRSGAKYAIILGDSSAFRKAFPAIDPAKITLDGFYTLRKGNEIFIVGRDDKGKKMQDFLKITSGSWWGHTFFERGTLFGVYDFLERFAGVRFFFDGEIGTVIPKNPTLKIPVSLHIFDRPDFTSRKTSWYVGRRVKDEWYNDDDPVLQVTGTISAGVWKPVPSLIVTDWRSSHCSIALQNPNRKCLPCGKMENVLPEKSEIMELSSV